MSEDPTQITLRTVLEAINSVSVELTAFREEMREFRATVESRLDDLDERMNVISGDLIRVRAREATLLRLRDRMEAARAKREKEPNPEENRAG